MGVHHLRLLRGGLPDRARAPAALLPHAPAPRDDGRRVPARAARHLRRVRSAEQPVGPARRHARRLGGGRRRAGASRRRGGGIDRLPLLRRIGGVVRRARPEDRRRVRQGACSAAGVRVAILGARETSTGECVRRAGNEMLFQQLAAALVATLRRVRHPAHRDLRSARLQHAAQRVPRVRRPLRGRPSHPAHREAPRRGPPSRPPRASSASSTTSPATSAATTASSRRRAPSSGASRATRRSSSRSTARRRCAAAPAAAACGWRRTSASASTSLRVEQALPQSPAVIATACPYCAVMMSDGTKALDEAAGIATRDIAELVAEALEPAPVR